MRREKTIWTREYKGTGRFCWKNGMYAIRKYLDPFGHTQYLNYYAVSVSPMRRSWYKNFSSFSSAAKFARDLAKRNK